MEIEKDEAVRVHPFLKALFLNFVAIYYKFRSIPP